MSTYYIAKDKERLERVFYEQHGVTDSRYGEFCEKNIHLITKDVLDAGDKVYLLDKQSDTTTTLSESRKVSLW